MSDVSQVVSSRVRLRPRVPRLVLSGVAGLVSTAALAGPAHAERWTYEDPAGDVTTTVTSDTTSSVAPVPDRAEGDIVRVVVRHRADRVKITIRTREQIGKKLFASTLINTPGVGMAVFWWPRAGKDSLVISTSDSENLATDNSSCPGSRASLNATKTTLRISIPRSCLHNPRWVRVAAGMSTFDQATRTVFDDDGLRTSTTIEAVPKFSPRIRR